MASPNRLLCHQWACALCAGRAGPTHWNTLPYQASYLRHSPLFRLMCKLGQPGFDPLSSFADSNWKTQCSTTEAVAFSNLKQLLSPTSCQCCGAPSATSSSTRVMAGLSSTRVMAGKCLSSSMLPSFNYTVINNKDDGHSVLINAQK